MSDKLTPMIAILPLAILAKKLRENQEWRNGLPWEREFHPKELAEMIEETIKEVLGE